jgi:peptidoglycan hydrolase-like protein with peptidoglycan-binding domain
LRTAKSARTAFLCWQEVLITLRNRISSNICKTLTIVIAATTSLMITAGNSHAAPGQISAKLAEAEQKLAALGYWVIKADGAADASTRHAITAFQKVNSLKRSGLLDDKRMNVYA